LSSYVLSSCAPPPTILSFPTRRSSDLARRFRVQAVTELVRRHAGRPFPPFRFLQASPLLRRIELVGPADDFIVKFVLFQPHVIRSEEHTSELQSRENLVCRLLLEKKKK